MKVAQRIAEARSTLFSFELLPPLKGENIGHIHSTVEALLEFEPAFVDVTYHREEFVYREVRGGLLEKRTVRKRPGTVGICAALQHRYKLDTVPHIICGGFTKEETENALIDLEEGDLINMAVGLGGSSGDGGESSSHLPMARALPGKPQRSAKTTLGISIKAAAVWRCPSSRRSAATTSSSLKFALKPASSSASSAIARCRLCGPPAATNDFTIAGATTARRFVSGTSARIHRALLLAEHQGVAAQRAENQPAAPAASSSALVARPAITRPAQRADFSKESSSTNCSRSSSASFRPARASKPSVTVAVARTSTGVAERASAPTH
jgi:hypothetical protein